MELLEQKTLKPGYVRILMYTSVDYLANSIDMIDIKSKEIRAESNDTYSKLEDIADELPDSSPRFILLSYPYTLVRLTSLLFYSLY